MVVSKEFLDIFPADATYVSLYQPTVDIYVENGADEPELRLHFTKSVSISLPTQLQTTDGNTHD